MMICSRPSDSFLLQNQFRRAHHRHAVDLRAPFLLIIVKKSRREQTQTPLGEQVLRQIRADVPGAHNPHALRQRAVSAVGRQVSLPQQAEAQPDARQAQEREQAIAQDDSARRRVSAAGKQPDGKTIAK